MEKRFVFRGNAVGVAGHLHKPEDLIIGVQGASSLPVIGGYAQSSIDRARFGDHLSFDTVLTRATGDYSPREKAFKTLTNSVVKGLNVENRLTADAIESTFTSIYPENGGEPSIVPAGTHITNLRIDGYRIIVTLDIDLFTKYATRESLANAYATDDEFFRKYGKRFLTSDTQKPDPQKREIPEVSGYIVCSIVSEVHTDHPRVIVDGNVLTLGGFGYIYLGELLITSVSRRLTLLRLKLGSPVEGEIACAEVESNGVIME